MDKNRETLKGLDGKIALLRWGKGPPVLALHGWLDNANSFAPLSKVLPRIEMVAIDLPGHGHSYHKPASANYHFIDSVIEIAQVIDQLKWEQFTLLGHSLGGAIGCALAAVIPKRIKNLVLLESLGPLTSEAPALPASLGTYISELEKLKEKKMALYQTRKEAIKARKKSGDLTDEAAECLVARGLKPVSGGYGWRADPRLKLASPMRLTEAQARALLLQISCPTLLISGTKGPVELRELCRPRLAFVKDLKTEIVDGGHHVHLEYPDRVADHIQSFLEEHSE